MAGIRGDSTEREKTHWLNYSVISTAFTQAVAHPLTGLTFEQTEAE